MVYTQGLGPCGEIRGGPSPLARTFMATTNKNNSTFERKEDGTIHLIITISQIDIKKTFEEIVSNAVNTAEITGFRKGKAPRHIVEPTLNKAKIKEEVLKKLLPAAYVKTIEEHNLKPIMNPKIHVDTLPDDVNWNISAITCEMPEINLGKYKDAIKKITAKSKIILPASKDKKQEVNLDEIVKELLSAASVTIPSIMVEQEVDRLLAQTLDEIKRLGLTLDQYLASTQKKPEDLRKEYALKAGNDIKLEFVLQKIAEEEKITVDEKELTEAIQKAKDPIERENLQKNSYMLASILRQQKTLDFLKNL